MTTIDLGIKMAFQFDICNSKINIAVDEVKIEVLSPTYKNSG